MTDTKKPEPDWAEDPCNPPGQSKPDKLLWAVGVGGVSVSVDPAHPGSITFEVDDGQKHAFVDMKKDQAVGLLLRALGNLGVSGSSTGDRVVEAALQLCHDHHRRRKELEDLLLINTRKLGTLEGELKAWKDS